MLVDVRVPVLAESVAEATLMEWRKQAGDMVKFGDPLIDVETDKVALEVVAPEDGIVVSILKKSGEDVESNELIAHIDTETQAAAMMTEKNAETATAELESVRKSANEAAKVISAAASETQFATEYRQPSPSSEQQPKLSPAVRNLLAKHSLNAHDIPASGDRLTKKEVLDYLMKAGNAEKDRDNREPVSEDEALTAADGEHEGTVKEKDGKLQITVVGRQRTQQDAVQMSTSGERKTADKASPSETENRVPMSRLRRRAAQRLLAAQQENAILTTFNEVNMKPVMELRSRYKDSFEKTHGVKLGFMSFFTRATVEALKKFPIINASVDGTDIIYHDYFDIGIAVSSSRGLVVPVIRAADRLSFAEIEKTIGEYGRKAHDAKLTLEELIGGTFTITNGGVFGSLLSTPIINPPQSAILGMHKIEERPIAENGAVVIRPMMYLALSYDHRIIDGREAVSFLVALKETLEDPSRLLLQI